MADVAPMTDEEYQNFSQMIDQIAGATQAGDVEALLEGSVANLTNRPLTNVPDPRRLPAGVSGEEFEIAPSGRPIGVYLKANVLPGRELDVESGSDWVTRLAMGNLRAKKDQHAYLAQRFDGNVRLDDEGNWIVGTKDDNGELKEVVLDEKRMSGKDVIDILGQAPEFILSMTAAGKAAKLLPMAAGASKSILGQSLAGGLAWSGAGGIKDIIGRMALGEPVDPLEIAHARGTEAALDTALGFGFARGVNYITAIPKKMAGLVPTQSEIARMQAKGSEAIKDEMGVELIRTPAERTGSPIMATGEGFMSKMPGAKGTYQELFRLKNEREIQFAEALLGKPVAKDVGESLNAVIRGGTQAAEVAVAADRRAAISGASEDIQSVFKPVGPQGRSAMEVGTVMETSAKRRLVSAKEANQKAYNKVYDLPESREDIFSLDPVANRAKEIINSMTSVPKGDKTVIESLTVRGPKGEELFQETVIPGLGKREIVKEAVDPGALNQLTALADRKGQKTRLFDLVQFRSRLSDAIDAKDDVLKGIGTHNLKSLRASITQAIEEGTSALPDGSLKSNLKAANSQFKDFIQKFDSKEIEPLLKEATERGSIDPEQFMRSIFASGKGNTTKWNSVRDFYGKGSPEFNQMKQWFMDDVLGASKNPITGTIDASKIFMAAEKLSPEIAQDLFGGKLNVLAIKTHSREIMAAEGKLNYDEFLETLNSEGGVASGRLKRLVEAERVRDLSYRNSIVSELSKGKQIEIEPAEFVERFLNAKVPLKDIKEVMRMIERTGDSDLLESVRQSYLLNVFRNSASRKTTPEDFIMAMKGQTLKDIDPGQLIKAYEDKRVRDVMSEVLDPARVKRFMNFAYYAAGAEKVREARGLIGSLAPGMIVSDLFLKAKGLDLARYYLISKLMSSKTLSSVMEFGAKAGKTATFEMNPKVAKELIRFMAVSPEFAKFVASEITDPAEIQALAQELRNGQLGDPQP